jgi:hypothetical protein
MQETQKKFRVLCDRLIISVVASSRQAARIQTVNVVLQIVNRVRVCCVFRELKDSAIFCGKVEG